MKDATVTYQMVLRMKYQVKVTVAHKSTQADVNTPVAKDQTVRWWKHQMLSSIGNVGDLPEGTKLKFKTPVDTTTPGDKEQLSFVTYPNGWW